MPGAAAHGAMLAGEVPPGDDFLQAFAGADEAAKDVKAPSGLELADVSWPLVSARAREVEAALGHAADLGVIEERERRTICNRLVHQLYTLVFSATSRVMVVEMAAAESTGLLPGATPEERHDFFAGMLADPSFCAEVLGQYPVLERQLDLLCRNWKAAHLELLSRLAADRELIRETFFPASPPGSVVGLDVSAGDAHRRGRSTCIVRFAEGARLVYKPRPLAVDVHFRALAGWINGRLGRPQLLVPLTVDRGDYGWSAFIAHEPLDDEAELATYYERLGALLALAYVTGLSDLHADNLIAHGAWPVAVDLETLFRPLVKSAALEGAAAESHRILDQSVLGTQLLAIRMAGEDDGGRVVDLGGIADLAGQETPFEVPVWRNLGRVDARLDRARQRFEAARNIPVLNGIRVPAHTCCDAITGGFVEMYRLLWASRAELAAGDGPLAAFSEDRSRVVLRGTTLYARLLSASFHPDFLGDAGTKREFLAAHLGDAEPKGPGWQDLVAAEIDDLWQGDIPCFTARAGCRELVSSEGRTLDMKPVASGLDLAFRRLEHLGAADLARQGWLIRVALTRIDGRLEPEALAVAGAPDPFDMPAAAGLVARTAADAIVSRAIFDADRKHATWLAVGEAGGLATVADAALDLYSGLPGIAVFLSHAGRLLDAPAYRDLARCALAEILLRIDAGQASHLDVGGFAGGGGLAWALQAMAGDFPDLGLDRRATDLLLAANHEATADLDVTSGLAGALMCCLAVHRSARTGPDADRAAAARLLDRASMIGMQIADRLDDDGASGGPAGSFAHGRAGIAAGLARLFAENGEERIGALARRLLDETAAAARSGAQSASWCRGQAGVVLALAEGADFLADRQALAAAMGQLAGRPMPGDHSLCHGAMGTVMVLQRARRLAPAGEPDDPPVARLLGGVIETGLVCGTVGSVLSPGLMDGLAGIGLGALAIMRPDAVPSVLSLDAVPAHARPK